MTTPPREPFNNTSSPIASVVLVNDFALSSGSLTRIPFNFAETNENGAFDFINSQFVCFKAGLVAVVALAVVASFPLAPGVHVINGRRDRGAAIKNKRLSQFNNLACDVLSLNGTSFFNVDVGDRLSIEYFIITASTDIRLLGDPTLTTDFCQASFYYIT